jgi:ABC-type nitrate/sulfonate/bicarbonate transport system permease component
MTATADHARRRRTRDHPAVHVGLPILAVTVSFLAWELFVRWFDVPSYVLPAPSQIVVKIVADRDILLGHTLTTLVEVILGFIVGVVVGFGLAVLMAESPLSRRTVYPILIITQAIPVIAIAFVLVLLLGFGLEPKIAIVGLIIFFTVVVNAHEGLTNVDPDIVNLARAMGASRSRILMNIRVPASISPLFAALKLAATYSITGAIFGEWTSSTTGGLGVYLLQKNSRLDTEGVWAAIFILAAMGLLGFGLVALAERLLTPWRTRSTARRWPWSRARRTAASLPAMGRPRA